MTKELIILKLRDEFNTDSERSVRYAIRRVIADIILMEDSDIPLKQNAAKVLQGMLDKSYPLAEYCRGCRNYGPQYDDGCMGDRTSPIPTCQYYQDQIAEEQWREEKEEREARWLENHPEYKMSAEYANELTTPLFPEPDDET